MFETVSQDTVDKLATEIAETEDEIVVEDAGDGWWEVWIRDYGSDRGAYWGVVPGEVLVALNDSPDEYAVDIYNPDGSDWE